MIDVETLARRGAAAEVISKHRLSMSDLHRCLCGEEWTPGHVAVELDKAQLLTRFSGVR